MFIEMNHKKGQQHKLSGYIISRGSIENDIYVEIMIVIIYLANRISGTLPVRQLLC